MTKILEEAGASQSPLHTGTRGVPGPVACLQSLSNRIAGVETWAAGLTVFGIFCLLLGNVVSRSLGNPLIWTDELAVFLMAWAAFIGASLGLARRQHIAITLLPDALRPAARRQLAILVDVALLVFLAVLSVQIWRWFDPVGVLQAASIEDFTASTFNFIYQEPTVTLGMHKVWFWLVMPVFCVTATIHVLASLAGRLTGGEEMAA
ncbi:TRAP transporter small permease (plasmid) [Tistrella mobilis]|uniref:TRAP transporter small permease n=1 Tax=Tistrella mobilis TaxID=171437 RepID=UPI003557FE35